MKSLKEKIYFNSILIFVVVYTVFKLTQFDRISLVPALILGSLIVVLMTSWLIIFIKNPGLFQSRIFHLFAGIGAFVMGLWGTFILLALVADSLRLIVYAISLLSKFAAVLIALWQDRASDINLCLLLSASVLALVGWIQAKCNLIVRHIKVSIPHLAPDLNGLKIAHLSDLHVGLAVQKGYVEKVVKLTNAISPDLIFITGDLIDAKVNLIAEHLAPLANLKAKLGIFFVPGNHEYYWNIKDVISALDPLEIRSLINDNVTIAVNQAQLLIAGPAGAQFLPDTHTPDIAKAAQTSILPDLKILLAHRPAAYLAAEKAMFNLQFSGHTHAGQFFPFSLLIPFFHKYYRGMNNHGRLQIYVNPGTGYWGPANRLGIPAEITCLKISNR